MNTQEIELKYIHLFENLHIRITNGRKAPHKAILLLSIIDLVETGVIDKSFIPFSQQIDKQFVRNWMRYVSLIEGYKPRVGVPFWHMDFEPYWETVLKEDSTKSFKQLADERVYNDFTRMKKVVLGAKISDDLFKILQDSAVRAHFRVHLIKSFL